MTKKVEIDSRFILQPIDSGSMIPSSMSGHALFLLNLGGIVDQETWDNMGDKERAQASKLRAMTYYFAKMADLLEELGLYLSALPDPYDFENGGYEQSWEEINEEADTMLTDDYAKLHSIIDELLEAASYDFED